MTILKDALLQGDRASQPAAATVGEGTLYFVTDEEVTEQQIGAAWVPYSPTSSGAGTVTSVAMSVPAEFSVAGSPVTTTGTLAVTKVNQNANIVWAGPASGAAAAPSFRALVAADLPSRPQQFAGRLTLTTAVPVTTSNVSAATTVYLTPYKGNVISLYDGTNWVNFALSEINISVPATTVTMYDIFVYDSAGLTLEAVAWTNDTTRATALAVQDGVYVKTGTLTKRYVGSFRTTGVSGQTEDSLTKRYLWNYYNRVQRPLLRVDATNSWSWSTGSYQQANASAANQVEVVVGVLEDKVDLNVMAMVTNSTGTIRYPTNGIGVNSATVNSASRTIQAWCTSTQFGFPMSFLTHGALGYTYYTWLEYGGGTETQTWYGDNGATLCQTGIQGYTWG